MPPKSAVERSEYRPQIDELLKEGKTPRFISDWLKHLKKNPENISHTAINNYRKNKFNVKKEATIKYNEKKSKEIFEEAVEETVSDLGYCDDIIKKAREVGIKVDKEEGTTALDIKKLGLQAVRVKQEIFKAGTEDEKEFTIKIVGVDNDGESDNLETES
jgi:hypothetical protein